MYAIRLHPIFGLDIFGQTEFGRNQGKIIIYFSFQVGSFNFDNRKMVFENYLLPVMPNHTKSILDYDVQIRNLRPEATFFVPAETGMYIAEYCKITFFVI